MYIARGYYHHQDEIHKVKVPIADQVIPIALKRRLTPLGQKVCRILIALESGQTTKIPWAISSRHGDTVRMKPLFDALVVGEIFLPTDFSLSVHNAIYGMYSIATENKCENITLSGGVDSAYQEFIEAYSLSRFKNAPVGYLYYDDKLPDEYDVFAEPPENFVSIGFILDPMHKSGPMVKPCEKQFKKTFLDQFFCCVWARLLTLKILNLKGRAPFG
jgi:hypothetical protein